MNPQDCTARLRRIENELQRLNQEMEALDQDWESGGHRSANRGLLRLNDKRKQLLREREVLLGELCSAA